MTYNQWLGTIVFCPEIKGGTIVWQNSRLSVASVGKRLLSGESARDLKKDYPFLSDEDIEYSVIWTMRNKTVFFS